MRSCRQRSNSSLSLGNSRGWRIAPGNPEFRQYTRGSFNLMQRVLHAGKYGVIDCFNPKVHVFHATEDYKRPAEMPVYAMADEHVSFSGKADDAAEYT